ncbi:hypothetical protein E2320_001090 [Naja naja]|nr:hypothetical protein E2320_001090 [Naja naja]
MPLTVEMIVAKFAFLKARAITKLLCNFHYPCPLARKQEHCIQKHIWTTKLRIADKLFNLSGCHFKKPLLIRSKHTVDVFCSRKRQASKYSFT